MPREVPATNDDHEISGSSSDSENGHNVLKEVSDRNKKLKEEGTKKSLEKEKEILKIKTINLRKYTIEFNESLKKEKADIKVLLDEFDTKGYSKRDKRIEKIEERIAEINKQITKFHYQIDYNERERKIFNSKIEKHNNNRPSEENKVDEMPPIEFYLPGKMETSLYKQWKDPDRRNCQQETQ